jgi:hypothetical protein
MELMPYQQVRYGEQVGRVGSLVEEIKRAYEARDFARLTQLGNRLATDSVIAGALAKEDEAEDGADPLASGPARAA